ncbi:uncharacterized protein [Dysidea avara]|uniref:uncharacterized protein n=1 Tax=Dysidea avara TaxID=196820 RepID=UPI00332151C6
MADRYFGAIRGTVTHNQSEDYDYSLLITGITGSGKSSLCGFICCDKEAYVSKPGFASETANSAAAIVTLQDKKIKLIDTPGFCDDFETDEQHMAQVGEGIFSARKGVNAVGLAINAGSRYTKNDTTVIKEISEIKNLWTFTFIIFTHADSLGDTDDERKAKLKSNLALDRCPEALKDLMKRIKHRYILVDSTNNTEEYHRAKVQEIVEMVDVIYLDNDRKLYTNELFNKAKEIAEKYAAQKKEILGKKKMAELNAIFEAEAAKQAEVVAKQARIQEQLAKQKELNLKKRLEGEELQMQKQREEKLAQIEKEKLQLQDEKEKIQDEIAQLKQKVAEQQDDEAHQLETQAQQEALEELKKEFNALRVSNDDLRKKRSKKWYGVLTRKSTGKECVIQ